MTTTPAMPELPRETVIAIGKKHFPKTNLSNAWFGFAADIALATLQAQPAEVSDEEIIAIKKATKAADPTQPWGDTLAFARAILALRPQAVPMTPERIVALVLEANAAPVETPTQAMTWIVRAVEAHHGITAPAGGEG